jgi:thymus-specific serine protease
MMYSFLPSSLLALLFCRVTSALRPYRYLDVLNEKKTSLPSTPKDQLTAEQNDVQELFFTQKLDHFDPLNHQTYQQRYFYSNRYVDVASGGNPITFLCVGGEGPGFTKAVLVNSDHCTGDMIALAHKLFHDFHISVHIYALEHRYYGHSYPDFGDQSPVATGNLKYLSSKQALEDLAHFVQTMQQQEATATKWVAFGGSYPGYMAGNARLKHPQLIFAAVSSSVPLDLEVDFPGYNERVGWDLAYEKIGGSGECFDIVKNGHREAVALLEQNPKQLAELFHVCDPETALSKLENQKLFLGDGLIELYVQGNDPSCQDELCNIERICSFMIETKNSTPGMTNLDVLVDVATAQRGDYMGCRSIDFQQMLDELAKPIIDEGGWRSWLWQTCTEVGFYQTCIHESCPYATHFHTVDQDLAICQAAYNITNVYENIQATRDYYGGLDISAGSRVLSVNGDVDPWSVLAIHESPKYSLPVAMVAGASHHFWTHEIKDTDAPEIQYIRSYIYSTVMDWLGINSTAVVNENLVLKQRLRHLTQLF